MPATTSSDRIRIGAVELQIGRWARSWLGVVFFFLAVFFQGRRNTDMFRASFFSFCGGGGGRGAGRFLKKRRTRMNQNQNNKNQAGEFSGNWSLPGRINVDLPVRHAARRGRLVPPVDPRWDPGQRDPEVQPTGLCFSVLRPHFGPLWMDEILLGTT